MNRNNTGTIVATAVALLVVCLFAWLVHYMIGFNAQLTPEKQGLWANLIQIFNVVQAMAAAALGVLLGTSVQTSRVAAAEADKAKAETKANVNEADANRARNATGVLQAPAPPGGDDPDARLRAVWAALQA